jgi:hypothetical protein
MSFERWAIVSSITRLSRSAAIAVAITLACFPGARTAQAQTTSTVTNLNDSGPGSLRAAIMNALSGQSTIINFAAGLSGAIPLASPLSICNGQILTIQGGPASSQIAVNGQNTVQVFNTCAGTNVTISSLTIENGFFNTMAGGVGFNGGAGIQNFGSLAVINSTFSGNATALPSAGGGGIFSAGTLTVTGSTFSRNTAAGGNGGGIYNVGGTTTVTNSTFSGNDGGALVNTGLLNVSNSTITGNGPGVGIADAAPNGSVSILIKSTILAANAGGNCNGFDIITSSRGYNLSDDATCQFKSGTDLVSTPAGLDPKGLQNNGGPTQTVALLPTSAAVDAIPVASCTDLNGNPVAKDQRGDARPQGKGCDIGAYELIQAVPFTSFQAGLIIFTGKTDGYGLTAEFTLNAASSPINPATDAITLQVASYNVTIPAGSLKHLGSWTNAPYAYEGIINGATTGVIVTPLGGNRYGFAAGGYPVDVSEAANPVTVKLTIGNNSGTTTANAIRIR